MTFKKKTPLDGRERVENNGSAQNCSTNNTTNTLHLEIVAVFVDGSCVPNPGSGGWGVVVEYSDGTTAEFGGFEARSTNQQMELRALIEGLRVVKQANQEEPVTIYSDSEYALKSAFEWLDGWKSRGWRKADGRPIQNLELIQEIDSLLPLNVKPQWVRGHSGNPGQERADRVANAYRVGGAA